MWASLCNLIPLQELRNPWGVFTSTRLEQLPAIWNSYDTTEMNLADASEPIALELRFTVFTFFTLYS